MTDTQGIWDDIAVDDCIRDKNGNAWRVCVIDDTGALLVKNRHNQVATLAGIASGDPVTFVSHDDPDACITLLRDRLGAEVMGWQGPSGEWSIEPWPEKARGALDKYREHLLDFHKMWVQDVSGAGAYQRLIAHHRDAHADEEPLRTPIPHTHPYIGGPDA